MCPLQPNPPPLGTSPAAPNHPSPHGSKPPLPQALPVPWGSKPSIPEPLLVPCSSVGHWEALDPLYGGSPDADSAAHRSGVSPQGGASACGEAGIAAQSTEQDLTAGVSLRKGAPVPQPASYKDVLLRPRTFKPRFPSTAQQGEQPWLAQRPRRTAPSVSSRQRQGGNIHDRREDHGGGYWLRYLRAKAGSKCFNCLAAGHRIASCRDPPRCILCLRFGHKARFCRRSSPAAPSRAHRAPPRSVPAATAHRAPASSGSSPFLVGSSRQVGGHYRRCEMQQSMGQWKWQIKQGGILKETASRKVNGNVLLDSVDSSLTHERRQADPRGMNPMLEEARCAAGFSLSPPIVSQRSVEPTADKGDVAVSDNHIGVLEALNCMDSQLIGEQAETEKGVNDNASVLGIQTQPLLSATETVPLVVDAETWPLQGPPFDLNVDCMPTEDHSLLGLGNRITLGMADARLNMEASIHNSGPKHHGKGIARLAVPLKKSLLCNPSHKTKASHGRKSKVTEEAGKKITRTGARTNKYLSADEKATALLLQASGIIEKDGLVTNDGEDQFSEQFTERMSADLVGDMRDVFGLNTDGAGGCLNALVLDAEE